MSEKMTVIRLPGGLGCGWMEHGETTAADIIAVYRKHAEREKAAAEEILAAADSDFKVEVVRGVHVQHPIKTLQEGLQKPSITTKARVA